MTILEKIKRKLTKLRYQPIRVFCFHQTSAVFDASTMWECDWTEIELFKRNILKLRSEYTFISLQEANDKLRRNSFRVRKYAVLTSDDGYATLNNILPWLEENKIPITLFINSKYMDGESWSPINEEQALRSDPNAIMTEVVQGLYLTKEEIWNINSPLVAIGMHGHEHLDATKMTDAEFEQNVNLCKSALEHHPRFVPYWAYTWGRHDKSKDVILRRHKIIPVLISGQKNYTYNGYIDRECFDGE